VSRFGRNDGLFWWIWREGQQQQKQGFEAGEALARLCIDATAKATGQWLADGIHPTHRKVRDGWGTRAFVLGEWTMATARTTARARAKAEARAKAKGTDFCFCAFGRYKYLLTSIASAESFRVS
jgi:hypothetical protein